MHLAELEAMHVVEHALMKLAGFFTLDRAMSLRGCPVLLFLQLGPNLIERHAHEPSVHEPSGHTACAIISCMLRTARSVGGAKLASPFAS